MTSLLPSELTFQRNLAALAEIAPEFHQRMATMGAPASEVVVQPDDPEDINLQVDGVLFYRDGGARRTAERQVGQYLEHPERLNHAAPPRTIFDEDVTDFVRARLDPLFPPVTDEQRAAGPAPNRGGVMIMFGVGLGHDLELLFQRMEFRHLALVEPYAELLWHSLWLQDWTPWIERLASRRGSICLLVGDDAETTAEKLELYLRTQCYGTMNASYIYQQYSSTPIEFCRREAARYLGSTAFGSKGFFEDQLLMLKNTTRNLAIHPIRLVVNNPLPPQPLPAIIVGAGPSLDKALPDLVRLRDQVVLFSAGTTLRTLLNNGLKPDFQCEIENGARNYDLLAPLAESHDLSGITLLASTTVDPRVPALFERQLFYVRDRMVSAALYGSAERTIVGTSPNCATLAMRMAVEFGFREVYFFGTDYGSRRPDRHHTSDSVWMSGPDWHARYETIAKRMEIVLPGNFGGRAYTNPLLRNFLNSMQFLLSSFDHVRVFNCSDGVRIRGTTPRLSGQVRLEDNAGKRAGALAALHDAWETYPPGALTDVARVRALLKSFHDWAGIALAALRALRDQGCDLVPWYDAIQESFDRLGEDGIAIRFLAEGSTVIMLHHAVYCALWHRDLADRQIQDLLIEGLEAAFARMGERLDEVIADAVA